MTFASERSGPKRQPSDCHASVSCENSRLSNGLESRTEDLQTGFGTLAGTWKSAIHSRSASRLAARYNGGMEDKRKLAGALLTVIAFLILLSPVIYVISIGPVVALIDNGYVDGDSKAVKIIYAPIVWSVDNVPVCRKVLTPYVTLWISPEE